MKRQVFLFSLSYGKCWDVELKSTRQRSNKTVKYKSLYGAQLAVFNKGPTPSAGGSAHARPHKKQCEEFKTIPRNAHWMTLLLFIMLQIQIITYNDIHTSMCSIIV
jgi:hypothetical protein